MPLLLGLTFFYNRNASKLYNVYSAYKRYANYSSLAQKLSTKNLIRKNLQIGQFLRNKTLKQNCIFLSSTTCIV